MYESRSLMSTLQPFANKNVQALLIYVLVLFQNRVLYYKNWSQKQSIFIYISMCLCLWRNIRIKFSITIHGYIFLFTIKN